MRNQNTETLLAEETRRSLLLADHLTACGIITDTAEGTPDLICARLEMSDYQAVLLYQDQPGLEDLIDRLTRPRRRPSLLLIRAGKDPVSARLASRVDGIITDPYDSAQVRRRILKTAEPEPQPLDPDLVIHQRVTNILSDLSITPRYLGHHYVREAIKLAVSQSPDIGLSKVIYPELARRHGITPDSLEHTIRNAIRRSWERADLTCKVRHFGPGAVRRGWVPTNSEFILTIVDQLRLQQLQDRS